MCDQNNRREPCCYNCSFCNAVGCKLWRSDDGQRFIHLYCAVCASHIRNICIKDLAVDGSTFNPFDGRYNYYLGELLPAVPRTDGEGGFWGRPIIFIKPDDWRWWILLPTFPEKVVV